MGIIITRRGFMKGAAAAACIELMKAGPAWAGAAPGAGSARPVVAVAKNAAPGKLAAAAVLALGGMGRFVGRGDVVVVKPNIGWDRTPEQAANTNPEVVKAVVRMCLEAGAKRVRIMDRPCNDPRRCYKRSGIKDAVESLGDPAATVEQMDERKFVDVPIRGGGTLAGWQFHKDVLDADKRINVPIAKHHNAARLTMSLKNIMGVLGGNRGNIHHDLDENIAGLNSAMRFDLIVLDAVRVLTANGPQGGRLQDVKELNTVVAGTDPVAVDSYAATLFGITARDVPHVVYAAGRGLGEMDLRKVKLVRVDLG